MKESVQDDRYQIAVNVEARYVVEHSSPEESRYVFAYTIKISNHGKVSAKLINRHWLITDGDGGVEEVRGRGVVGEQPSIKPGDEFQYTSGAVLKTPVGSMEGSYGMLMEDGVNFDADIPPFSLAAPNQMH